MLRSNATVAAGLSALATSLVITSTAAAAPAPQLDVYAGDIPRDALGKLVELGIDRHELELSASKAGGSSTVHVETILSGRQAEQLADQGITVTPKELDGQTATQRATALAAEGYTVFKKYSGPGGLKEEFTRTAARHPLLTKLISIGKTTNGEDIVAIKISAGARFTRDGSKPSVLYLGAQHAREWITPEMNRRLMHYFLDNYSSDRKVRRLVNERELWIVPVANPDGYDFTFTAGQRLWRKNLRDNNGDGTIAPGDGVDLNRNYAYKWGYDNEGSSPNPASETYRGPGPNSEPETKALDAFVKRVRFDFFVNYHSAAELLLYGIGWQVATPSPDDVIGETLAGDDAEPAVPGYDPDISAELYTTNGDTDTHMTENYGTFGFTPEMSTCEAASDSVPDDEWEAEDCTSGFIFPDDEELVQTEFENNIPFALSVAESADDPANPESVVGREAEDFRVDSFDVSYGDPQTVAVVAKRELRRHRAQLPHQQRTHADASGLRVGRRRALRRREQALLRRVPRPGPGHARRRPRQGLVQRREAAPERARPGGREPVVHLHRSSRTRARRCSCSPTRTTRASTRPTRPARTRRSTPRRTWPRSAARATAPTSGISTPTACRTTSASSATTTRSSGTSATTASRRIRRTS